MMCAYLTRTEDEWLRPALGFWEVLPPVRNLQEVIDDSIAAANWQAAFDAMLLDLSLAGGGVPADWEVVGRVAYKRLGSHSVRYPDGDWETRPSNPRELALRDAVVAAIRLMYLGVNDFADRFLIYGGYAPSWENPYGGGDIQSDYSTPPSAGFDYRHSPDNFLRSLQLDLRHDYIFLTFVDNDYDSRGYSRTQGVVQMNLRKVFSGQFYVAGQPGPAEPDLVTEIKNVAGLPSVSACASGDAMFASLGLLCHLAGLLAHEIGHKTWANCFGFPSGIQNQFEGRAPFASFSGVVSNPLFPTVPFPFIQGNPAVGAPGPAVTRHFILKWLDRGLMGWLSAWDVGMASELQRVHGVACRSNCESLGAVGATGYMAWPGDIGAACTPNLPGGVCPP